MPSPAPAPIHHRAAENLAFIRSTLERSGRFTAVPGRGGVIMGVVAIAGAWLAHQQSEPARWLMVWIGTACVGFIVAFGSIALKARAARVPLLAGSGRKFAFALAPSLVVAVLLTISLAGSGQFMLLPALWLLLYGTAVTASGAFSIPAVGVMGIAYLALGAAALFMPDWGDFYLAAGFGGLDIGFGIWIWRRHGG
jgi:hypothetical protein